MEIEEMKSLWDEMSVEIEKQKRITDSLIIRMTKVNYRNKVSKILLPEAAGGLVCIAGLIFLLVNINQLNDWYLLSCGIISALLLFLLPLLSIKAIYKIHRLNISHSNYKQTLLEYSRSKMQFLFIQKVNFYGTLILMLTVLPVVVKVIDGVDMFKEMDLWLWYAVGFPFFYYFSQWVFKNYIKTTSDAVNILKELGE